MDTSFDLNYLILIPTVLVSGLVLFVCGFKKPVEPPLFELADEKQKKKQKTKDTRQATNKVLQKQPVAESSVRLGQTKPMEIAINKKEKPANKKKPVEQSNLKNKRNQVADGKTEGFVQNVDAQKQLEESTGVGWITVQDRKQKKTTKSATGLPSEKKTIENEKQADVVRQSIDKVESPIVQQQTAANVPYVEKIIEPVLIVKEEKKTESVPKAQDDTKSNAIQAVQETLVSTPKAKKQKKKQTVVKDESSIKVVEQKETPVVIDTISSLLCDAAKESTTTSQPLPVQPLSSKKTAENPKKVKSKNTLVFKEVQIDESMILIDTNILSKTDSNQSSSDSVQEIDDWTHVKPKPKKVRREQ